jgi:NADH dehydrogenase
MRIAITGGTGFVGGHLARALVAKGHEVVLIARGFDRRDESIFSLPNAKFSSADLSSADELARAFSACGGVAHCAGINREIGRQTYAQVHVEGTRRVVEAARRAGVGKIALLSFLRARPNCGSAYHESKWAAEEIVRFSGLDYTVIKPGVIYGRGDHMLDHISHALYSLPVFALVGRRDTVMRPLAIEDLVRILEASLIDGRLSKQTVAVMGPEEVTGREAVRRIARVLGKRPVIIPMPLLFHSGLAWTAERLMKIPLLSLAQLRILSEGIVEPLPACASLPADLLPKRSFTDEQIQRGLPERGGFGLKDLRSCR